MEMLHGVKSHKSRERGELRSWVLEVRPVFLDEFNQFCPYTLFIKNLMEPESLPFCILAALPIGSTSDTINTSSLYIFPLSAIWESCFVHPLPFVTSYCYVVI